MNVLHQGKAFRAAIAAEDFFVPSDTTGIDLHLRRKRDHLNLVAMSWGGSVAGAYTAKNNSKIKRLALIAPLWLRETPGRIDPGGDLPAYREVDLWKYEESWRAAAPKDQRDALIPPGWFEVWAENTLATSPPGAVPNTILAPSGAIQDIREYWVTGRPFYDPGEIRVPVLLIHAEWDIDVTFDTTRDFFSKLTSAPYRRWIEIGQGTHMVILEKNRWQAVNSIIEFLREDCRARGGDLTFAATTAERTEVFTSLKIPRTY
jgi:pimeloyl-ACP methyl ester carboxylesterase